MVSKQVKLRLALTRAIVNFFSQEDLYCDELQIQGTVCITADKSAIFVTQITETITDADHAASETIREEDPDDPFAMQLPLSAAVVIKEPLATSLKLKKSQTTTKHTFYKAKGSSDPNLPTAGFNNLMTGPLSQVTASQGSDTHTPPGAITTYQTFEQLPKFNYTDTLRNSIVHDKLIADGKQNDVKNANVMEDCSSDDSENSLEGCVIVQPSRQSKHPASSSSSSAPSNKKLKTDPSIDEDKLAALNLTKRSSAVCINSPRPTKTEPWLTNRPLLPVNPILTPVFPGNPERQFALNPSIKQEKIDDVGSVDLRVSTSPGTHGLSGDMTATSDFPWHLASPPDGHPSFSDWPANSWVRKPKTKFSPEQLRSLEDAYQCDPFLSTCAERRAELARKLNLTEKNIQIWFQNQRRRRRAAAYSRLHYPMPDSAGSSAMDADQTPGTTDKDLEEEEIIEVREEDLDDEEEEERKNDVESADKKQAQNGIEQDEVLVNESTVGTSPMVSSLLGQGDQDNHDNNHDNNSPSGLPTV